jgi:hypothetical protein
MEKQEYKVKMVYPDDPSDITRIYTQTIQGFLYFARELKISPKSNASWNKKGFKVEFFVDTVSVSIGIGKDHTADLIMTKDAWDAFVEGAEISIDTVKEFEGKYIKRRKKNK